jgi:hypothetical protein
VLIIIIIVVVVVVVIQLPLYLSTSARDSSLLQNAQTGYGAHIATYSVCIVVPFQG